MTGGHVFFAIWRVWESKKWKTSILPRLHALRKEIRIPSFPKIISRFRFWPKRAIAMEMGIETSPTNWQTSIWWNASSRLNFFLFERLVLGELFYFIFLQVDEIWCSTYMDPVTWVWPPKSSSRMKWRETKLKRYRNWRQNDFETYPNDTEIEGSFAFVRESWSVNCLFERYFAGDYVNLVRG